MALLMRFSKRTLATDRIALALLKVKNALNMPKQAIRLSVIFDKCQNSFGI